MEEHTQVRKEDGSNCSTPGLHAPRTVGKLATDPQLLVSSPGTSQGLQQRATIQVTVRASFGVQRTWSIPKALLLQHSVHFQIACKDPSATSITLQHSSLSAFQNFIDFVHSSIYSPNKNASDYHCIRSHLEAWVLGKKLGAEPYRIAALRELYAWVEPLARSEERAIEYSPIGVEDIKFVSESAQQGEVVRAMIFDAVAAHCTQDEAIAIADALVTRSGETSESKGAPSSDLQPEFPSELHTPWEVRLSRCDDFRERVLSSRSVEDENRSRLLRPIKEYLDGKVEPKEEEFRQQRKTEEQSILFMSPESAERRPQGEQVQIDGRHMRSPSRRCGSSASNAGPETTKNMLDEPQNLHDDDYMTEDGDFVRLGPAKTDTD